MFSRQMLPNKIILEFLESLLNRISLQLADLIDHADTTHLYCKPIGSDPSLYYFQNSLYFFIK